MATGLALPVGVNSSGGARLVSGDENDDKIIKSALGDDYNENAFMQNIGLGNEMIFDTADNILQASIQRKLIEIFKKFKAQKRYLLRENSIKWTQDSDNQQLILEFKYLNIETDEEKLFSQNFS